MDIGRRGKRKGKSLQRGNGGAILVRVRLEESFGVGGRMKQLGI